MKIKKNICNNIRKRILTGDLNPGERLIEADLSKRYGVSRNSIREALSILTKEGFVTHVPNKGAKVAKTTAQELIDYYHLLALLEGKAVEWTARYITSTEIEELSLLNNSIRDDIKSNIQNWSLRYVEKNVEFHRFFWDRCGNKKLIWVVEEIRQRLFRYRYISLTNETYIEYLKDHDTIINALNDKDPKMAATAMENHILKALDVIRDIESNITNSIKKMHI